MTMIIFMCTHLQHWTKLKIAGAKPPARCLHAACCIAGPLTGQQHPLLLVVGGSGDNRFGDMWLLDVDKRMWSEVRLQSPFLPLHCMLYYLTSSSLNTIWTHI